MNRPTLVLLGSAGSGKGTQAYLINKHLGYLNVETGQIFRDTAKLDTPVGRHVAELDKHGLHATDELITQLIYKFIVDIPKETPLLIDGYPRSVGQAQMLKGLLKDAGRDPESVIALWIKVSRQEAQRRLMNRSRCLACRKVFMTREILKCPDCGGEVKSRIYDTEEGIKNRLDHFENVVMKVIELYKKEGKLFEINGEQPVEDVFKEIKKICQGRC